MRNWFLAAIAAGAVINAAPAAAITLIDFEGFSGGDVVDGQPFQFGDLPSVTITAGGNANPAIIFDTNCKGLRDDFSTTCTGGDSDLSSAFPRTSGSPGPDALIAGNAIIISEDSISAGQSTVADPDDFARGGSITFSFGEQVQLTSVDLLDIEEGGIEIFSDNLLVAQGIGVDRNGEFFRQAFDAGPIGSVFRFDLTGSGALDNLLFSNVEFSAIPVPASLPLMLGALGIMGVLRRRRQA